MNTNTNTNTHTNTDGSMQIRDKIVKYLEVYGRISPSMLHTGIGPSLPSAVWRPVLEQLIADGVVHQSTTEAHGRRYPVLSLTKSAGEQSANISPNPKHTLKQV